MKKALIFFLAMLLIFSIFGCKKEETPPENLEKPLIGVSLAGGSDEATVALAEAFEQELTRLGFVPAVQCAEGDCPAQIRQIEELIALNAKAVIVQAVDSITLLETEQTLKECNIPLIGCDTPLMDTDVAYGLVTYDYFSMGQKVAEAVVKAKGVDDKKAKPTTIELFMGAPEDGNSPLFSQGVLDVLKPYLESGKLVCKSGQTAYEDTYTPDDAESAKAACTRRLRGTYTQRKPLEICIAATDEIADGCRQALDKAGYTRKNWPALTGAGGTEKSRQAVKDDYMLLTVEKDPLTLARACAEMAKDAAQGKKISTDTTLSNNAMDVPTQFVDFNIIK